MGWGSRHGWIVLYHTIPFILSYARDNRQLSLLLRCLTYVVIWISSPQSSLLTQPHARSLGEYGKSRSTEEMPRSPLHNVAKFTGRKWIFDELDHWIAASTDSLFFGS
jgi:hypothetical protein